MRECPLLVSDCAVREQLKRVKALQKKKQTNKKKTVRQTNKKKQSDKQT